MTQRWLIPLLLILLAGCGSTVRAVRLDTGRGEPIIYTPRANVAPVEVDKDDFEEAVARLARDVRPSARPLEAARQQFGRLQVDVLFPAPPTGDSELTRAYLRWCARALRAGDCLRLLGDDPRLSGDGRYVLAMAIAQGSVLGETQEALEDMVDPQAVVASMVSTATLYMLMWTLPEPTSKGVASVLTLVLMGYLGVDTVWGLIAGWVHLVEAVERATTFEQIRDAGERYGEVMGENAARLFVLLATAAVGRTGVELADKLPMLPGAKQVAVAAEARLGVRYAAAAEVAEVAVAAEGAVIALAPGALAMAAKGMSGRSAGTQRQTPPSGGPGKWVEVNESMSEAARNYQAQVTGAPKGKAYRVEVGGEKVDFDGFKDGVLLEAKGSGYAKFIDDELEFKGFFKGAGKLLEQAQRQFRAARGTPIRWVVAEEKLAGALQALFRDRRVKIEVVQVPPAR